VAPKAGADPTGADRPDPEVVAKAKRRRFTAKYKQQILAKADAAGSDPGAIGALLRREKLYSSHLVAWRRQREASIRQGLEPRRRGPKSRRDPVADENQKLRRENERLTEKLRKAELIIDVQKKLAALLGASIPPMDREGQR
jgi:transposase-like protein